MKRVVFAARRREGVVVAPIDVTNNMNVEKLQSNEEKN
jgi:hypothetical protein